MTGTTKKEVSTFVQSALALDEEFDRLERLSGELERVDIGTDNGLERARVLLARFGECGGRLETSIQALAVSLTEAQKRAQLAAQSVAARSTQVQERQREADQLLQRFQALGEMARKITEAVSQLQRSDKGALSDEDRNLLLSKLPEIDPKLGVLVDEAFKIKADAHAANLTTLERNADSLGQSMQAMRRKLNSVIESLPSQFSASLH